MSDTILLVLRLCLLALLYLFFFRVVRAVWVEVRTPATALVPGAEERRTRREPSRPSRASARRERRRPGAGPALVVVEPPEEAGRIYDLGDDVTIGRAAACRITVDDNYVSQLHARVQTRDGQIMVEDLGSTNGTYLNRQRLTGMMVMKRGDTLQVGNTILELR